MISKYENEEKIRTLCENKWLSLKVIEDIDNKIPGYVFSHETSCNGNKIAILPYRFIGRKVEFLLRHECTPCWGLQIEMSSLTGGVDKTDPIEFTVIKELEEESGYSIKEEDLISLNQCYGTKSTDTIYYLFTVDLTDKKQTKELHSESELENSSFCKWHSFEEVAISNDPLVGIMLIRILKEGYNASHNS